MKKYNKLVLTFVLLVLSATVFFMSCTTYHHAYQPTPSGVFEEKNLPEAWLIETSIDAPYYENANNLFRRLFNYISKNDIEMTVPVESEISGNKSAMRFYIGPDKDPSQLKSEDDVNLVKLKNRLVVAHGARGSYSKSNIEEARQELEKWLSGQPQYSKLGEPYAVFWDSPFKLWFLKRFEIHIPVEKKQ